jgi:hypothetical protein
MITTPAISEPRPGVRGEPLQGVDPSPLICVQWCVRALPSARTACRWLRDEVPKPVEARTRLTSLLDLSGRPSRMRVIAHKERPHPGAQLRLITGLLGFALLGG